MSLYYISENHNLSSSSLSDGSWTGDQYFENYSTTVDTRSLSISLFPEADNSSSLDPGENSTTNVALLYYENSMGEVSALLHRLLNIVHENSEAASYTLDQWINITSQESQALPNEFRSAPGFNYSNSLYKASGYDNCTFSHTLYEADPIAVYGTPFFSAPNFFESSVGAMFYSPFNLPLNATSPLAGDSFFTASYTTGLSSTGNFSLGGMHHATHIRNVFREIIFMLGSTPPSKDYTSIHQSDIAPLGSQSGIWINGTQPALIELEYNGGATLPSNEFPFTRLASVTLTDGSATYLHHQMNGTTFAEEQWDDTLSAWLPTEYIIVSDS